MRGWKIWVGLSSVVLASVAAVVLVVPGGDSPVVTSLTMGAGARLTQARTSAAISSRTGSAGGTTSRTTFPQVPPLRSSTPSVPTTNAVTPTTRPTPSRTRPPITRGPRSVRPTPSGTRPKASSTLNAPTTPPTTTAATTTPPTSTPSTTTPPTTLSPAAAALAAKEPILALGDSVTFASSRALTATFGPEIRVDAAPGRSATEGITRLERYRASGELAHFRTVVIDLGTNGPLTPELFNELVEQLQGVRNIVFYDTYDTDPWESATNAALTAGVLAHPGMIEINWAAVAPGPGLLDADNGRPTPAGATAFASLLATALS